MGWRSTERTGGRLAEMEPRGQRGGEESMVGACVYMASVSYPKNGQKFLARAFGGSSSAFGRFWCPTKFPSSVLKKQNWADALSVREMR
jgi:hypothetical protein